MSDNAWCVRCGHMYLAADKPTCECAGEPPARGVGVPITEWNEYRSRVARLRYVAPQAGQARRAGRGMTDDEYQDLLDRLCAEMGVNVD